MKIIAFSILLILFTLYTIVVVMRSKNKSKLFYILVLFLILFNCTTNIILHNIENIMKYKVLYVYYNRSFLWIQALMECYVIYKLYKLIKGFILKKNKICEQNREHV